MPNKPQNGLSNAIKFSERGKSVRLRTAIELIEDRPGWALLTVTVSSSIYYIPRSDLTASSNLLFLSLCPL
jgi:hypothetical protein